jgi:hypothetical protein
VKEWAVPQLREGELLDVVVVQHDGRVLAPHHAVGVEGADETVLLDGERRHPSDLEGRSRSACVWMGCMLGWIHCMRAG